MSKRIDVFTEELKKVWTILQQQQVMINAIKDNINAIDKNATDIDSVNKVVPTDIDMDANGKLVLKHDGQELTGQVKNVSGVIVVPWYEYDVQNTNIQNASKDVEAKKLIDKIKALNYDNGTNYPIYIYDNTNGWSWYGNVYCINKEYTIELFHIDAPDNISTSNLLYNENDDTLKTEENDTFRLRAFLNDTSLKTIFGNQSLVGSGNIDLYRHELTVICTLTTYRGEYYSSNNLVIDSVQDLTKVTKAINGTTIYLGTGILTFDGSIWKDSPGGNAVTSVSDIVTTI